MIDHIRKKNVVLGWRNSIMKYSQEMAKIVFNSPVAIVVVVVVAVVGFVVLKS